MGKKTRRGEAACDFSLRGSMKDRLGSLPPTARFQSRPGGASKVVLFDVMDTLVADPFFGGFERDLFGIDGGIKALFAIKDQDSFVQFETGALTEEQHFATYFCDRRPVDGGAVRRYLQERYAWLPGMRELASELAAAGVPLAAFSNYPAPWAPLVEEAVGLSEYVPWAFVSGEQGVRKPSAEAYRAACAAVGRGAEDVIFVDDSATNVAAAESFGIPSIRFRGAEALRPQLRRLLNLPLEDIQFSVRGSGPP